MADENYPVPMPPLSQPDPRYVRGLLIEVAAVLVRYGYPPATGIDAVRLEQALFGFIYEDKK